MCLFFGICLFGEIAYTVVLLQNQQHTNRKCKTKQQRLLYTHRYSKLKMIKVYSEYFKTCFPLSNNIF